MKVFFAELASNPAYYSFGYSVYGELESGDHLADVYEKGFLPFVGAREQKGKLVYMTRGSRVDVPAFEERHYHARVLRKIEAAGLGSLKSELHPISSFDISPEFIRFFLDYFRFRFGKDSMPEERLHAILDSGFVTHIRSWSTGSEILGYTLEVHDEGMIHVWYHAYQKKLEGKYFGLYLYIDILRHAKAEGIKHLYLGVSHGRWMSYKTNFQPLEYWDGREWVRDTKSRKLKELMSMDSLRQLAFTDSWRDALTPYYKPPYPYESLRAELRILTLIAQGLPRTFLVLCLAVLALGLLALAANFLY